MKKIVYTVLFIAGMQVVSQAQTQEQDKPKKTEQRADQQDQINPDGTISAPKETKKEIIATPEVKNTELMPESSRSAITEKGVPATKTNDKKKKTNSSSGTPKIGRD